MELREQILESIENTSWILPAGLQNDVVDAVLEAIRPIIEERDKLRAEIEALKKQEPAMWANSSNINSSHINKKRGGRGDQHTCSETQTAYHDIPLYLAPGAQPAAAPEGWQLVPIEPDDRMLSAARVATESEGIVVSAWLRRRIYDAMLAAAPKQENKE